MAAITIPTTHTLRIINPPARPWLHTLRHFSPTSFSLSSATSAAASSSTAEEEENSEQNQSTPSNSPPKPSNKNASFYPKRGQTLELVCETLAFKAKGVCKVPETGFVLMCDRALPGERFIGRVTRKKGSYAEVAKLKTLSPHQDAVDAPCEYASYCGGCKTQNLSYEAQLKYKEQQVWDLVLHVGKFSDAQPDFHSITKPIIPCANQFHYRNKMEFSFSNKRWIPQELWEAEQGSGNDYALGLHAPGFFDKILNIDKCLLQSEPANAVLLAVQDCWRDQSLRLSPYNVHTHAGFLKHLVIRTGSAKSSQTSHSNESIDLFWNQTNLDIRDDKGCPDIYRDVQSGKPEIMVNFVTSEYKPELLEPLVEKVSAITEVASIVNNINTSVGSTSVGEKEHVLYGKATIAEVLRGLMFQISANSFFQTNTQQAEVLYELIENVAGLKGDGSEYVLDLFCGTGTIGLTLARRAKHVYGYEVVPQAIADARRNADLNGICNATFVQGDLNKIDENFGKNFPRPDVVISDPNRPGMHMKLIKFLLKLKAPRIVYVSCNPATCARDLDYLCHGSVEQKIEGCYQLRSIQPVDMFPHTPHIECVCLLDLNE